MLNHKWLWRTVAVCAAVAGSLLGSYVHAHAASPAAPAAKVATVPVLATSSVQLSGCLVQVTLHGGYPHVHEWIILKHNCSYRDRRTHKLIPDGVRIVGNCAVFGGPYHRGGRWIVLKGKRSEMACGGGLWVCVAWQLRWPPYDPKAKRYTRKFYGYGTCAQAPSKGTELAAAMRQRGPQTVIYGAEGRSGMKDPRVRPVSAITEHGGEEYSRMTWKSWGSKSAVTSKALVRYCGKYCTPKVKATITLFRPEIRIITGIGGTKIRQPYWTRLNIHELVSGFKYCFEFSKQGTTVPVWHQTWASLHGGC